jgi:hypothetical protein
MRFSKPYPSPSAVRVDESKSRVCSFYPAGTMRCRKQLSLICGLLHLQRAGLIDPIDTSLDDAYKFRRRLQTKFAMRTEPHEFEVMVVWFAVN